MYDEDEDLTSRERIPIGVWVFHALWASAAVIGIAAYLLRRSEDRYSYIETTVLTFTLLFVAWNVALTRKMQQAMVKQINVNILPILEVAIRLKGETDPNAQLWNTPVQQSRLELKNVGQAAALNVKIESIFVDLSHGFGFKVIPMKFDRIYSLSPNQSVVVKDTQPYDIATARGLNETRPDLFKYLVGAEASKNYELKIWFTDILGNKYVQVVHTGADGIWADAVQEDKGQVTRTEIEYNKVLW
jgi:hypothetical protein